MIQLRAIYLSNEDVEGTFSNVSEALENLKPEAFSVMIDADIALFNQRRCGQESF